MKPRSLKRLSHKELEQESRRLRAQREAEERWQSFGNLTDNEIKELSGYEFRRAPNTLRKQLRRYRLLLKVEKPERADAMWNDLSVVDYRNPTEVVVVQCCHILYRYWSGFILHFDGKKYTKTSRRYESTTIQV